MDHLSREISVSELDERLAKASIPVLVLCLAQITGDPRWLGERYRPARTRGLADDPTGGLPDEVQDEVRRAMRDAVLEWIAAGRPSLPVPTPEQMPAFMEQALGAATSSPATRRNSSKASRSCSRTSYRATKLRASAPAFTPGVKARAGGPLGPSVH